MYCFFNSFDPVLSYSAKTISNPREAERYVLFTKSARTLLGHGHCPNSDSDFSSISKTITASEDIDSLGEIFWNKSKAVFLKLEKTFKGSKIVTKLTKTEKGINKYFHIFEKLI